MNTRKTLKKLDYVLIETEQKQFNQPKDANITKLIVERQGIAVIDDFKYLDYMLAQQKKTLIPASF